MPALAPRPQGPDEIAQRRVALDRVWDEAVAHGKTPVVALRAVVAGHSASLADALEVERAARLAEALLRGFDAVNKTSTLPAKGVGEKLVSSRVAEAAVRAVVELRSAQETDINLPFLHATAQGPLHLERRVTRRELELLDVGRPLAGPDGASAPAGAAASAGAPTPSKRWWWPFG